jgi:3-oxoacyl-(acyl-carrier-protein) synthase
MQALNIPTETKFDSPKIVVSLSSGFGGANTAIVMEKVD